ncbi:MAG: hypothetical protein V4585_19765 [Bacteroidota bacterium]
MRQQHLEFPAVVGVFHQQLMRQQRLKNFPPLLVFSTNNSCDSNA